MSSLDQSSDISTEEQCPRGCRPPLVAVADCPEHGVKAFLHQLASLHWHGDSVDACHECPPAGEPGAADDDPPVSADMADAARSLVRARDGLMATLLHLAEHTATETEDAAVLVLSPLLAALPVDEQHSLALGLTKLANFAWGTWYPGKDRAAEDKLRAKALSAADRVIRVLRADACLCREVRPAALASIGGKR